MQKKRNIVLVLRTGALFVEKVPQNHRHAAFTNNLQGSRKSRQTRYRSDNDGFDVLSPAIIVHSAIVAIQIKNSKIRPLRSEQSMFCFTITKASFV